MNSKFRQPIVVVLGHIDSGKTSLLDKIRGTAVQSREAGGITQHIGASFFPIETLEDLCGNLLEKVGGKIDIPGILVIDTPGHAVFTNLRNRGGSASDISILVIDAMKGIEVQTRESLDILKKRKVPFLIALNKLDTVPGWRPSSSLTSSLKQLDESTRNNLDGRIYDVVGELSRYGIQSEAFYRLQDPQKQVAIVPVSAKTGEGIPELISLLIGLTQSYLKQKLTVSGDTRGIVLEVTEEPGLGDTANIILTDGILNKNDEIAVAKKDGAVLTKIKAIFMPKPLDEMRDPRDKFSPVNQVVAATGAKISTSDLEGVLGGSPIIGITDNNLDAVKNEIESEIKSIFVETDNVGIIVKADTLGSLEAVVDTLKESNIAISTADTGMVSRKDVIKAQVITETDKYLGSILAFGVKVLDDAKEEANKNGIRIFSQPVLYDLVDEYQDWVTSDKENMQRTELDSIILPCKFQLIKGMVFRRNGPAVCGVEILGGSLKQKSIVINSEGKEVGVVKQIQDKGENIQNATKGSEVAISMNEPVIGRTIREGEILYSLPDNIGVRLLKERYSDSLSEGDLAILNEIIELRRKIVPLYGF
ncbi:MAG: translation initiation factor IF-2 [Thaumarchaeota archaeon]|nr:translation initiation factor IF-2 [Nitrososphaerota archaeon]|tara:strand:+ start:12570 stop:14342 length:1773 start_codon:yes stop_codon:yes gene_type:complete